MEGFINYKRINKIVMPEELEIIFKDIIKSGDEIVHYQEQGVDNTYISSDAIRVTIITGKRQNRII